MVTPELELFIWKREALAQKCSVEAQEAILNINEVSRAFNDVRFRLKKKLRVKVDNYNI